jgi:hypothetical protein
MLLIATCIWSLWAHLPKGFTQAASYKTISVDGSFGSGEWSSDETFTNIAGSLTDFRITWSDTYLYFGFNGGNVQSDKFIVALDTDPGASLSGNAGPWAGVNFPAYGRPDYIIEFKGSENTVYAYGVTASNVQRGRNTTNNTVELGISRSDLNNLSTGAEVGVYMYASNISDSVFAFLGSTSYGNPSSGSSVTPVTGFYFPTTGSGLSPNTYYRYQSHIFSGKTVSPSSGDQFHDVILDSGTLTGPSSGTINVAGDFKYTSSGGGTFNLNSCTVNFNGSGAITGGHSTGVTFYHVTIASGATVTADSNFLIGGNWTNSGSFTASAGTATMKGSSGTQAFSGASTFYNLTLDNSGATTSFGSSSITIRNSLTASAGTMSGGTSTFTFTGTSGTIAGNSTKRFYDLLIDSGANITNSSGGNLEIAHDFTNNGTFTSDRTCTFSNDTTSHSLSGSGTTTLGSVTVQGSTTLSAGSHSFYVTGSSFQVSSNGTFNGGSATVIFGDPSASGGSTTVSGGGTIGFNNIAVDTGDTLVGHSTNMNVAGNWTNNGTFTHNSGKVTFNGTTTISGSGTHSFNNVTVNSSSSLTASSGTMNVVGNWTNNGTFTHNSGTVTFNGTTTISGSGTHSFNNVTVNSSSSLTAPSGTMNVAGNWTNNGTFTHNGGKVTFNKSGTSTFGGSSTTTFYDLEISSSTILDVSTNTLFNATNSVRNKGQLKQTQTVSSGIMTFLNVSSGKYYGVEITPASSMGSTTVTIYGEQACSQPPNIGSGGKLIKRCYVIEPDTTANATTRFWYDATYESNDLSLDNVNIFHEETSPALWRLQGSRSQGSSGSFNYVQVSTTSYSRFAGGQEGTNLVMLASFTATPGESYVLLTWETASEIDKTGFNVWRSEAEAGPYVKLNTDLIPTRGGPTFGASYTYFDKTVTSGVTYWYKVEDVDIHGVGTMHGPVWAIPRRLHRIFCPVLKTPASR